MNGSGPRENEVRPVLACLGEASRYRLVRVLAEADRCVGELAEEVGLSQSCTTRHLQVLERLGLVKGRREGRRVWFSLRTEAPGLGELLSWALAGTRKPQSLAGAGSRRNRPRAGRVGGGVRSSRSRGDREAGLRGRDDRERSAEQARAVTEHPKGRGVEESADLVPRPRPGDLEDYLL